MTKKTAISAAVVLLVGAGVMIAVQKSKDGTKPAATETAQNSQAVKSQTAGAEAAPPKDTDAKLQQREGGDDADWIARYGEARTNLSKDVTGRVMDLMDNLTSMMDMASDENGLGRMLGGRGGLRQGIGRIAQDMDLSDDQLDEATKLVQDYQKRQAQKAKEAIAKLRENPRALTDLLLAGDAYARGQMDESEYRAIAEASGMELEGIASPLSRGGFNNNGQFFGDEEFNNGIRGILDPDQLDVYNGMVDDFAERGQEMADNRGNGGLGSMPAMELEQLDETITSVGKFTSGLQQMMEGAGGLAPMMQGQGGGQ